MTKAVGAPRRTACEWRIMSSIVTGRVELVPEHGHAEAVADQDHLDARLLLQVGGRIIVAGQPGDRLAVRRLLEQIRKRDFLAFGHSSSLELWIFIV